MARGRPTYQQLDAENRALKERLATIERTLREQSPAGPPATPPAASGADFFCRLVDHAPVGLSVYQPTTLRPTFANKYLCELMGYSLTQFQAMSVAEREALILPREAFDPLFVNRLATLADGETLTGDTTLVTAEGKMRHLGTRHWVFERDADGRPCQIATLVLDITAQRQIELALDESRHFVEQLMATTPAMIYLVDAQQMTNLYANTETMAVLGYTPEEIRALGSNLAELIHPDDAALLPAIRERWASLADGEVARNEFRMRHRNQAWRWLVSYEAVFARDDAGRPLKMLGVAVDITERREAERALGEANLRLRELNSSVTNSRDLLRAVFDGVQDGLALLARDGVILACNSALARLCGQKVEQLVGKPLPGMLDTIAALVTLALASGERREWYEQVAVQSGRIYDVSIRPVGRAMHEPDQFVLHINDSTERVQIESLTLQNEQLLATSRLAAVAAHELGTPLQAVQNCLYLIDAGGGRSELIQAQKELERIGGILRRLADIQGVQSMVAGTAQINDLIESVLLLTGSQLRRQRIDVTRHLDRTAPAVSGASDQVLLVLLNLVLRAAEAMTRGGKLDIFSGLSTEGDQPLALIILEYNGIAAEEAAPHSPVAPFLSVDSSDAAMRLAISRRIVEQHGGRLLVEEAAGFSRTTIMLPTRHTVSRPEPVFH